MHADMTTITIVSKARIFLPNPVCYKYKIIHYDIFTIWKFLNESKIVKICIKMKFLKCIYCNESFSEVL